MQDDPVLIKIIPFVGGQYKIQTWYKEECLDMCTCTNYHEACQAAEYIFDNLGLPGKVDYWSN